MSHILDTATWPISKWWPGIFVMVLSLYYLVPLIIKRRRYVKLIDQIPGEKAYPIIGNALEVMFTPFDKITGTLRQKIAYFPTASIIRLWMFYRPFIFILKAEAAEIILNNSRYIRKADNYKILHPWLGQGLLTSDNPKWKIHRRLLTPSFHFKILEQFVPIFNEQSDILLKSFEKYKDKEPLDMYRHITLCTLDVICEAAMGKRLHAQTVSSEDKYIQAVETFKRLSIQMFVKPWLQVPWIVKLLPLGRELNGCIKIMHGFTEKVIKEKKEAHEMEKKTRKTEDNETVCGQKKRLAFLDTLLDTLDRGEGHLTDTEIREEVDTFMFEGHDTTSISITLTLFILGFQMRVQEKIYEELEEVLGSDEHVTIDHLPRLKYLDAVIKESLRLLPSVPIFARHLTEDVKIDGYLVPAGTDVYLSPFHIHRDFDVYLNPSEFQPERFLSESWQKRHPYAYIPFSAGARNCIGQKFAQFEEKVILAQILRRYKIFPSQILEEGDVQGTLVITPTKGIKMSLQRR